MAARQDRDQGLLDHVGLAENHLADALAHQGEPFAERLDLGNEVARRGVDGCGRVQTVRSLSTHARFGRNRGAPAKAKGTNAKGANGKPAASETLSNRAALFSCTGPERARPGRAARSRHADRVRRHLVLSRLTDKPSGSGQTLRLR